MNYDKSNVFAKILRGEIPADVVYEDTHTLAFKDINPQAPVHILVIPKGEYKSFFDFAGKATTQEMEAMNKSVRHVVEMLGLQKDGFRILANHGSHGGQEVDHYHVHIFGGRPLGRMIAKVES